MKKIKPKRLNKKPVEWNISERARNTVKHFSEYSERTEEDIVALLILGLLNDENFFEWIHTKKNNIRIINDLGLNKNDDV